MRDWALAVVMIVLGVIALVKGFGGEISATGDGYESDRERRDVVLGLALIGVGLLLFAMKVGGALHGRI